VIRTAVTVGRAGLADVGAALASLAAGSRAAVLLQLARTEMRDAAEAGLALEARAAIGGARAGGPRRGAAAGAGRTASVPGAAWRGGAAADPGLAAAGAALADLIAAAATVARGAALEAGEAGAALARELAAAEGAAGRAGVPLRRAAVPVHAGVVAAIDAVDADGASFAAEGEVANATRAGPDAQAALLGVRAARPERFDAALPVRARQVVATVAVLAARPGAAGTLARRAGAEAAVDVDGAGRVLRPALLAGTALTSLARAALDPTRRARLGLHQAGVRADSFDARVPRAAVGVGGAGGTVAVTARRALARNRRAQVGAGADAGAAGAAVARDEAVLTDGVAARCPANAPFAGATAAVAVQQTDRAHRAAAGLAGPLRAREPGTADRVRAAGAALIEAGAGALEADADAAGVAARARFVPLFAAGGLAVAPLTAAAAGQVERGHNQERQRRRDPPKPTDRHLPIEPWMSPTDHRERGRIRSRSRPARPPSRAALRPPLARPSCGARSSPR
jgi:hypothetical protein